MTTPLWSKPRSIDQCNVQMYYFNCISYTDSEQASYCDVNLSRVTGK